MANIRPSDFIPHPGYLLVRVEKDATDSVIDIAQNEDKQPADKGVVAAVGKPKLHESGSQIEAGVKVGDLIVFKPYGLIEIMLDDLPHRIIDFDNVRGILKKHEE